MIRPLVLACAGLLASTGGAHACELNEIQKQDMTAGFCRQMVGVAPVAGCTAELLKRQASEQMHEIALARRCGFIAEADKLEKYYTATTPIIAKLYSCADQPIDTADVEKRAKEEVDKKLAALTEACPDDVRRRLAGDLPKAISADEKSYGQARAIAEQLKLN